jgi:S1-C subfamily serine protease
VKAPLLALLLLATGVFAQGQGQPPAPASAPSGDTRYIVEDENFEKAAGQAVERLASEKKLINFTEIAQRAPKKRLGIPVPPPSTRQLPAPELADVLRHSTVALGLRYQEPRSKKWRFMIGATAFAVAPGIFSTSLHVMTIDPAIMREAQAVAITEEGKVFPVAEIIAASDRADTCLIRVPDLELPPLSLRGGVRPGEQIWCMSHPDGFSYMFTGGQVARISRDRYDEKHQPALHVEVTAEYCPGSSGGAVTDAAGNVVAQVSSINNYDGFTSRDGKAVNGIVSARTCTAAEELMALTSPGENEPVPTPSPKPQPRHRTPKDSLKVKPSPSGKRQGGGRG